MGKAALEESERQARRIRERSTPSRHDSNVERVRRYLSRRQQPAAFEVLVEALHHRD